MTASDAMGDISTRLNPSPKCDAGHYVDVPISIDTHTIEVADGEALDRVFLIGGDAMGETVSAAVPSDALASDIGTEKSAGGKTVAAGLPAVASGEQSGGLVIVQELPFNHIVVGDSAKVNIVVLILPGVSLDLPIVIDIIGEGAEVNLSGLYICGETEKVAIRTEIRHRMPQCSSCQLFNGIAAGQSKVDFFGKIIVAPDAQKTEAYQTNHNIVLSDSAHAQTKPQLEIYADDVKCSHGATIGQLNKDEQFYMRSRGIPEAEARVLQMISFIAPVLDNVRDRQLRKSLAQVVESAIRNL